MPAPEPGPRVRLACLVTSNRTPLETSGDLALLEEEERAASARFLIQADRRDYIGAHALARSLLSKERPEIAPIDWRFGHTSHGKPILAAPAGARPDFSLTHTRGMVACAVVSAGEIGIDIESDDRRVMVETLASEVCSDDERRQLDNTPTAARKALFLDLWTLKEAYLKALGLGIAGGALAEASFDLCQPGAIQTTLTAQMPSWRFLLLRPTPTARIAVAIRGSSRPSLQAFLHVPAGEVPLPPVRTSFSRGGGR